MRIDRTRKYHRNLDSDRNRHLNTASPRQFLTLRFEAGLRAHEIWRAAFPSVFAQWHLTRPRSLTVAGAAQELAQGVDLLIPHPANRTCFPIIPSRRSRHRHLEPSRRPQSRHDDDLILTQTDTATFISVAVWQRASTLSTAPQACVGVVTHSAPMF